MLLCGHFLPRHPIRRVAFRLVQSPDGVLGKDTGRGWAIDCDDQQGGLVQYFRIEGVYSGGARELGRRCWLVYPSQMSRFCGSKTCRLPVSIARVPMITGTLW